MRFLFCCCSFYIYKQLTREDLVNLPKLKLELNVHIDLVKLLEIGEMDSNKTEHIIVNSNDFPKSFKTFFE